MRWRVSRGDVLIVAEAVGRAAVIVLVFGAACVAGMLYTLLDED